MPGKPGNEVSHLGTLPPPVMPAAVLRVKSWGGGGLRLPPAAGSTGWSLEEPTQRRGPDPAATCRPFFPTCRNAHALSSVRSAEQGGYTHARGFSVFPAPPLTPRGPFQEHGEQPGPVRTPELPPHAISERCILRSGGAGTGASGGGGERRVRDPPGRPSRLPGSPGAWRSPPSPRVGGS